jgi:diadenosine tetraphosphate (Ap4A) HIT family hydrolase
VADWRDDRIASAHRGKNPLVVSRLRSGFAVIGDTEHLPGYSLLLTDDPAVNHLTDLDWERRTRFLFDLGLVGEAVAAAAVTTGCDGSITSCSGNSVPILHGHVHARYEWEPSERIGGPVWRTRRGAQRPSARLLRRHGHGALRAAITAELGRLVHTAPSPGSDPERRPVQMRDGGVTSPPGRFVTER